MDVVLSKGAHIEATNAEMEFEYDASHNDSEVAQTVLIAQLPNIKPGQLVTVKRRVTIR